MSVMIAFKVVAVHSSLSAFLLGPSSSRCDPDNCFLFRVFQEALGAVPFLEEMPTAP